MTDPADRELARTIAEAHWRDMMDAAFRGDLDRGAAIQRRLDERILEIAAQLPSDRSNEFLAVADEERNKLFEEYERDPDALKRRLGCATVQPSSRMARRVSQPSTASGVGSTIVQTAVRATVWETVRAIFRGFGR